MYSLSTWSCPSKSRAGRRVVAFPREIAPELRWHMERFVEPGPDNLVFVGPKGGRLRRSNFRDIWIKAAGSGDRCGHGAGLRFGPAERCLQEAIGHATGTKEGHGFLMAGWALVGTGLELGFLVGAGEGNRTLMTSLEGWGSTIELRPRSGTAATP
jgi:hypothetical protein